MNGIFLLIGYEYLFLLITPGAKAVGMASAFSALWDDATCVYYNPGAIGFVEKPEISSMNVAFPPGPGRLLLKGILGTMNLFLETTTTPEPFWRPYFLPEIRYEYWAMVLPCPGGGVGVDFALFDEGIFEATLDTTTLEFEPFDMAVSIGYGVKKEIGVIRVGVGASAKFIYSYLAPEELVEAVLDTSGGSSIGFGVNAGILVNLFSGLSFGISLLNLGKGTPYLEGGEAVSLPLFRRIGYAIKPVKVLDYFFHTHISRYFSFTYAREDVRIQEKDEEHCYYSRGFEVTLLDFFSYRWGESVDTVGRRVGKTYGYGLNLGVFRIGVATDTPTYPASISNWQVQVDFSHHLPGFLEDNDKLDDKISFLASCMVPGAGQFYRGSIGKGAALLLGSFCFSEWNYRKGGILPKVGLGVMYFLSVTDALLYLFQHR